MDTTLSRGKKHKKKKITVNYHSSPCLGHQRERAPSTASGLGLGAQIVWGI